jgi:uncharacterized membrane protein affecting hemolysin expression
MKNARAGSEIATVPARVLAIPGKWLSLRDHLAKQGKKEGSGSSQSIRFPLIVHL